MRFSITMDDHLVVLIDSAADEQGITRPEFIRRACSDALSPESTTRAPGEVQYLRTIIQEKEEVIAMLREDVMQWRGQAAALSAKIPALPAPRRGIIQGIREMIYGPPQ